MSSLVFERADGSRRKVGGYRFKERPASAKSYDADAAGIGALPPKVDLRPFMTPVEDQGEVNSCAANATAGAYEYLVKKHLGEGAYDVSRLFIYYNARARAGGAVEDEGAILHEVIESLREHGACSESTWPYDTGLVNDPPHDDAFSEASQFLVHDVEAVPTDLRSWKTALASGHPIIFGLLLFDTFDRQRKPGVVPAPSANEVGRESHGAHAMLCVGYSDVDKVFIVRNSWGTGWGDAGYCYIPYSYLINEKYNLGDSWVIHALDGVPNAEESWGDESSVLEDLTAFLGDLDDEAYEAFVEAMGDVHVERRLALLFLRVISADGDLQDTELEMAATHLRPLLEKLGSRLSAEKLLRHTARVANDDALLDETIQLFNEHLPAEVLASIAAQLEEAAGADGELADAEARVLATIVSAWQLESGDEEEADDDDASEDEGEEEGGEGEEAEDEYEDEEGTGEDEDEDEDEDE